MRDLRKDGAGWPSSLTGIEVARSSGSDEAATRRDDRCIVGSGSETFKVVSGEW